MSEEANCAPGSFRQIPRGEHLARNLTIREEFAKAAPFKFSDMPPAIFEGDIWVAQTDEMRMSRLVDLQIKWADRMISELAKGEGKANG